MSLYNNSFTRYWDHLFVELADHRTNDWFLIRDPMPGLTILGAYLYFVLSWGPRYMKHRKPMELTNILIVYNFLQVFVSIYLFLEGMLGAWLTVYSWKCEPVDFSDSPHAMRVARGVYVYFLAKISELLDTIFFVLRKKDRQITFLHMYHHTVMPMISWGATKYYPGGHGTFIGVLNSFVHIIMYFYYMMAAMGPKYQKYLWWKKYITTLQLAQFCIAFMHSCQLLWQDCGYPRWSVVFTLPNAIFFYYLFSDFYHKAYGPSDSKKTDGAFTNGEAKMSNGGTHLSNGETKLNGEAKHNGEAKLNGDAKRNGDAILNGESNVSNDVTNGKISNGNLRIRNGDTHKNGTNNHKKDS